MLKASLLIAMVCFITACAQTPVSTTPASAQAVPEVERALDMYVFPQQADGEGYHLQVTY